MGCLALYIETFIFFKGISYTGENNLNCVNSIDQPSLVGVSNLLLPTHDIRVVVAVFFMTKNMTFNCKKLAFVFKLEQMIRWLGHYNGLHVS
jgi:hypothetical protein